MSLTRRARPNVIFEAGMAFAIDPERTLFVSFGRTRPFADVAGLNILYLEDDAESRQKIASRLRNAGCDVQTDHKVDWIKAGDFAGANHGPESIDWTGSSNLTVLERRASSEERATFKPKVWVDLKNDGDICLDIWHLGWTKSLMGVEIEHGPPSMQVKIDGHWCPADVGVQSLHVPPSAIIRSWVRPTAAYDISDLKRRCSVIGQIGTLRLRVNGRVTEVNV